METSFPPRAVLQPVHLRLLRPSRSSSVNGVINSQGVWRERDDFRVKTRNGQHERSGKEDKNCSQRATYPVGEGSEIEKNGNRVERAKKKRREREKDSESTIDGFPVEVQELR